MRNKEKYAKKRLENNCRAHIESILRSIEARAKEGYNYFVKSTEMYERDEVKYIVDTLRNLSFLVTAQNSNYFISIYW